jgi:CRISPR/Cas system-associated protein Cas5 (RAMP superfamily)
LGLIANCIIYYNATLLSDLYETFEKKEFQEFCDLIKRLSPVAWQHINLIGKYEFRKNMETSNIQEVIDPAVLSSKISFC